MTGSTASPPSKRSVIRSPFAPWRTRRPAKRRPARAASSPSPEQIALRCVLGRIDQSTRTLHFRGRVDRGLLDMTRTENVEHALARREQIIGNDPAVTAPPHRLGAHDGAALGPPAFA